MTIPKAKPSVTSWSTKCHHTNPSSCARAALKARTAGSASPSLSPDSRFSEWRTTRGTRGLVTTEDDSTGSVGESRAPRRKLAVQPRSVSACVASATIRHVSGIATTSLRVGSRHAFWSISASTSRPSRKRITISATTARSCTKAEPASTSSTPALPSTKPATTKTAVSDRNDRCASPEASAPAISSPPKISVTASKSVTAMRGIGHPRRPDFPARRRRRYRSRLRARRAPHESGSPRPSSGERAGRAMARPDGLVRRIAAMLAQAGASAALIAAYGAPYALRARTLRRRGRPVPTWRLAAFATALVALAVAVSPPVDAAADRRLSAHMAEHVVIGDLAPLLVVLGLTGPLLAPVLRIVRVRGLSHPVVAFGLWAGDLYLWHLRPAYEGALRHDLLHVLEHVCFFAAGANLWFALLGPLPKPAWFGNTARLVYVLAVGLAGSALAYGFALSGKVFYPHYGGA